MKRRLATITLMLLTHTVTASPAGTDLTQMGIEDLMNVSVTSVSKKEQKLSDVPAAIHVVTADDIRRSGATTIPEALKTVPGLDVARIDANRWAISARGFNGRFANKLLVLVDGRSVYTPIFSGVYWENLDYLLQDIERIEVIRGPGATLWGANAVNGVINIITKDAADTQGGYLKAGGGDETRGLVGIRYGTDLGESGNLRSYLKLRQQDDSIDLNEKDMGDEGEFAQLGFRLDKQKSRDQWFTVQGDAYRNTYHEINFADSLEFPFTETLTDSQINAEGLNLLGRWNRILKLDSEISLQGSIGYNDVEIFKYSSMELELKHQFKPLENHEVVWGLGYRYWRSSIEDNTYFTAAEKTRSTDNWNGFVQDEIVFPEKNIALQIGTKIEENEYSGTEIQPGIRASWTPSHGITAWASASRSSRTPSRGENDFILSIDTMAPGTVPFPGGGTNPMPILTRTIGQDSFDAEKLNAYELGFRWLAKSNLSLDLSLYHNDYRNLRSYKLGSTTFASPFLVNDQLIVNTRKGEGTGYEITSNWQPVPDLKFRLSYSHLNLRTIETEPDPFIDDELISTIEDRALNQQLSLWTQWNITPAIDLDLMLSYTDERPWQLPISIDTTVDDYWNADLRLAWRPKKNFELSLIGKNLLEDSHKEFTEVFFPYPARIERSVYGTISLKW